MMSADAPEYNPVIPFVLRVDLMISNGVSRFKDTLTQDNSTLDATRAYLAIELTPDFNKLRRIRYKAFYSALIDAPDAFQ